MLANCDQAVPGGISHAGTSRIPVESLSRARRAAHGSLIALIAAVAAFAAGCATRTGSTPPAMANATPSPLTAADGRIVFTSHRDGNPEIYVMNADGSGATRLTDHPALDGWPAWSPDGQRIAFVSTRDGNRELYIMDADGSHLTRLTDNRYRDEEPAWSPDGQRIVFWSDHELYGGTESRFAQIYALNPDGRDPVRLSSRPGDHAHPTWSPDGRRIAFALGHTLFVMNADGSHVKVLLPHRSTQRMRDEAPAWSPDGRRIAFTSDRDGNEELYLINADGSGLTRLTDHPAADREPAWSPDGKRIAFTSSRDGNWDIYVIDVDGSGLSRLTDDPAYDGHPDWSSAP